MKATCPSCGKSVSLTAKGTLAAHAVWWKSAKIRCSHSGRSPLDTRYWDPA